MAKIKTNDCCCSDWRGTVKELWERYQEVVKSIAADGRYFYPDGSGTVNIPGIISDIELVNMGTYWNAVIDTDISTISLNEQTGYWVLEVA